MMMIGLVDVMFWCIRIFSVYLYQQSLTVKSFYSFFSMSM